MHDFSKMSGYLDSLVQNGLPGCSAAVYLHGEPVFSYCTGYADQQKTRPVAEDDIYYIYSCTKPVTVAAAMQLVEHGKLGLDDPVCRYLPEYADAYYLQDGKPVTVSETMKVWHLLTMSAGLDYDVNSKPIRAARERYGDGITTRQMVAAFVQKPLSFKPGERFQYSLCHDVLGAVIEVISGQSFGAYLREHIFAPLGMTTDTGFCLTDEQIDRVSDQYCGDGDNELVSIEKLKNVHRLAPQYESGGAGLFSTLTDCGRFAAAMSCGGRAADDTRILKAETVDRMRTPQTAHFDEKGTFSHIMSGYDYGLGVRTLVDRSNGQRSSIGEFGWEGAAGAYILMDPKKQVAIVYMQFVNNWPCLYGMIHEPLRDLTYEALGF